MRRRAVLLSLAVMVTASEAARLGVKAGRSGSPPPPPAPDNAIVPDSPIWDTLVGSSGQAVATWEAVTTLIGGGAISIDPITAYTVRWGTTEASVQEGGSPTSSTTTASLTSTRSLAAGTWWFSISASNAAGESMYSFARSVVVS